MTTTSLRGVAENYWQSGIFIISESSCLSNKVLKVHSYSEYILPIVLNGDLAEYYNNEALIWKR